MVFDTKSVIHKEENIAINDKVKTRIALVFFCFWHLANSKMRLMHKNSERRKTESFMYCFMA
ncbi:hypothetical protein OPIT5_22865 [Opitutaceae bacterium TAV5]|nr:hypothetical protein OPIT5_22865 [Opitutaceae bacterium TAV5]